MCQLVNKFALNYENDHDCLREHAAESPHTEFVVIV